MSDSAVQLQALNQQLELLLAEEEADWVQCLELVERRDALLADNLDSADLKVENSENSENTENNDLKAIVEASLELNKRLTARMQAEQTEVEQALIKVNQGKKARALYE